MFYERHVLMEATNGMQQDSAYGVFQHFPDLAGWFLLYLFSQFYQVFAPLGERVC